MLKKYFNEVYAQLQEHWRILGIVIAVILTLTTFVWNLYGGPLYNLNDMHSWSNRLLFTGYAAVVQLSLLLFLNLESDQSIGRLFVRELLVTASVIIMFLAMNQKTYAYNTQTQPIIRAMDTRALAAIPDYATSYSVPALILYYLLTRGPIYDMYLAKLFCIGCYELLCISISYIVKNSIKADKNSDSAKTSWKPECALALSLILPHGFLSSACAAQIEVAGVLCGVLAFILIEQRRKKTGLVLFGIGAAICTALWLLVPMCMVSFDKCKLKLRDTCIPLVAAVLCCVPGVIAGSGTKAFVSLLSCFTSVPMAGSGVPNLVSFFPRAVMEEMPEYSYLRAVPELDLLTLAADNYTQSHFVILMKGLSFACLAVYIGLVTYVIRLDMPLFCKCISLILIAFVCAPGLTMGTWLLITVACIYGVVFEPSLRLPCAIILFATAGGCGYPVTGETMIKPVYVSILTIAAMGMMLDFWPGKGK